MVASGEQRGEGAPEIRPYRKRAIPQATRRAVALRNGCRPGESAVAGCHWCGAEGRIYWSRRSDGKPSGWVTFSHELDHVVPEFVGGASDPDNIVLACRPCNRRRGWRG